MHRSLRRIVRIPTLVCALLFVFSACGDDDAPGADSGVDAGPDATPDAAPDAGTGDPCLDILKLDTVTELDPDGPDTQIHVNATFDGAGVWVVWNRPDGASYFDVWAQRLGCDGVALVPPFQVNTTDHNEVDPSVAVGDGNVYFAWSADNNTGINNMDLLVRTYEIDGTPLMAADTIVETTYDGTPVTGNVMSPAVAALPGGRFAVAGVRGLDVAPAWQVFAQRLHADGSLDGTALSPIIEPAATHMYPALVARPDGGVHLAWTRAEGADERVYHAWYNPGATTPDQTPLEAVAGTQGTGVSLATAPDGSVTYLAFGDGNDIVLTTTALINAPTPAVFSYGLGPAHSPVLATREGGGALAYYTNVGGLQNELHVAAFAIAGDAVVVDNDVMLIPQTVPPYQASITHVSGDVYFVAWSGGTNPDYRVFGMFVSINL